MTIRKVPELIFKLDDSLERGNKIERIISEINKKRKTPQDQTSCGLFFRAAPLTVYRKSPVGAFAHFLCRITLLHRGMNRYFRSVQYGDEWIQLRNVTIVTRHCA